MRHLPTLPKKQRLNGAKINLTTQMTEYANHLATKDYGMEAMTKKSDISSGK